MDICQKEYHTILQGEERTLPFKFVKGDGSPYTLGVPDEIIFKFPKATAGQVLEKKLTLAEVVIVSDNFGQVTVKLQEADTALLKVGERMDVFADITKGTVTRKAKFKMVLTVEKSTFA